MSQVNRVAGVAGTITYTTSQVPDETPQLTIYSDVTRTIVAVAAATLDTTGTSNVFTASYPATLAAGTYYLTFSTVYTTGQPAIVDSDDTLILAAAGGVVDAASTSTLDWIEEVKRHIYANQRPVLNKAGAVISEPGPTTVTFTYPTTGIAAGTLLSVGLESLYVWSADTGTKTAVCERGFSGSTIEAHPSTALWTVNPRVTNHEILVALNHELRSLAAAGIYQLKTVDRTFNRPAVGYDLAADLMDDDVFEVKWRGTDNTLDYRRVTQYRVERNVPTADFPSGVALFMDEDAQQGQSLRITYKAALGQLTASTDVVTATTGLPVTALDIPPLGAAIRLMSAKANRRAAVEVQGDTRRPAEASTSDVLNAASGLRAHYRARVAEEAGRLASQNPVQVRR